MNQNLGNWVNNSWCDGESLVDPSMTQAYEQVLEEAALLGVSIHFSSGDSGDGYAQGGYVDVSFPGSPYITQVGGVDLFLDSNRNILKQIGWGNNYTLISSGLNDAIQSQNMLNSPLSSARSVFSSGSGGGVSRLVPKPWYQSSLIGSKRQLPDISFLGNLIFSFPFIESRFDGSGNPLPGDFRLCTGDGTSLSAPLFSGLWSIANHGNGAPLGPASMLVYDLPPGALMDVIPEDSPGNVTGTITVSGASTAYSALSLGGPQTASPFESASFNAFPGLSSVFNGNGYQWLVLTFGTDSSLEVTPGFDTVTGVGVPNPLPFVKAVTFQ